MDKDMVSELLKVTESCVQFKKSKSDVELIQTVRDEALELFLELFLDGLSATTQEGLKASDDSTFVIPLSGIDKMLVITGLCYDEDLKETENSGWFWDHLEIATLIDVA